MIAEAVVTKAIMAQRQRPGHGRHVEKFYCEFGELYFGPKFKNQEKSPGRSHKRLVGKSPLRGPKILSGQ